MPTRALWVVLSLAAAGSADALPAVQTGLLGLTRLQTARLNVVNLAPAEVGLPPNPCAVSLAFLDASGEPFQDRSGAPIARRADLSPGESAWLELPGALAGAGRVPARRSFRGSVDVAPSPPDAPPNPCTDIVTTIEIYDRLTGRTSVATNPGPPTVDVQPGPPEAQPGPPESRLGLLGLARLQNARISVINLEAKDPRLPPNPCAVSLVFLDEGGAPFLDHDGRPLESAARLAPGESAVLELPALIAFEEAAGLRRAFRGFVQVEPGPPNVPPNPCADALVTLEIYDVLTGRTTIAAGPGAPEPALEDR
jgi:hypothetical protein